MMKPLIDAARLTPGRPMNRAPASGASWYRVAAADGDAVDVYIYDEIGYWGVTANDFVRDLQAVTASTINLHVNSPGGSVFDGIAIYNALAKHGARVVVDIDGWAASIASVIAMAGDEIRIGESAELMIHKPWSFAMGDAEVMRREADVLDRLQDSIVDIYVARTDGDRDEVTAWVNAETWFRGQEAVDAGFADAVLPNKKPAKPAARLDVAAFGFQQMPDRVRAALGAPGRLDFSAMSVAEFERFLRSHGASRAAAKGIAVNGFRPKADPRDADASTASPAPDPRCEDGDRASLVAALRRAAAILKSEERTTP